MPQHLRARLEEHADTMVSRAREAVSAAAGLLKVRCTTMRVSTPSTVMDSFAQVFSACSLPCLLLRSTFFYLDLPFLLFLSTFFPSTILSLSSTSASFFSSFCPLSFLPLSFHFLPLSLYFPSLPLRLQRSGVRDHLYADWPAWSFALPSSRQLVFDYSWSFVPNPTPKINVNALHHRLPVRRQAIPAAITRPYALPWHKRLTGGGQMTLARAWLRLM